MRVKTIVKKILPNCYMNIYNKIIIRKKYYDPKINTNRRFMYDFIKKEHIKHFGKDFPDKIFYVIRRLPPGAGLLSNYHWVLNNIVYALSKGYIPVVNMENYKTFYNERIPSEMARTYNAWEYYFEQPCGYSLKDIKKAKNIILADMNNFRYNESIDPYNGKTNIAKYYEFASQYGKINTQTMDNIKTINTLFDNKKNILGVSARITGYKYAKNHPTPPSIEQLLHKTRQVFKDENFDYVFLATEEQKTLDEFCRVIPQEKLIIFERERVNDYYESESEVHELFSKHFTSANKLVPDYLTEIVLLSRCDGIIASKNNGNMFALGWNNNKYRYSYIFDLGINL